MNIAYFISSLKPGGAEKQTIIEANLMSKDHKVFLFILNKDVLIDLVNPSVEIVIFKKGNYFSVAKKVADFSKNNKIQLIHASLFASMIISAISTMFYNQIAIVWHIHSHEYDIPFRSKISLYLFSRIENVKKILFVNTELQQHYHSLWFSFPLFKEMVLYNCAFFDKNENRKIENNQVIGYVGRLVELKRVEYLIELSDFLKKNGCNNHKIIIVGDGSEMGKLRQLSIDLSVNKHIHFVGFQNNTESFYNSFSIFALPSREECLSMALIDAGIKGIPSVAFDIGGNHEIIEHNKTGFLVNDKNDFFDKILLLINNVDLYSSFNKETEKNCELKFGRINHQVQLNFLYKTILDKV